MTFEVAVLSGDGIGPEVVSEAVKVLKVVAHKYGLSINFQEGVIGGQAIDILGEPLPQETLSLCRDSHAVLLGAVGGPKWDKLGFDKRPEKGLLEIREQLGLYANLRPAKLFPSLANASSIKREIIEGLDILVVRELIGGIYYGKPKGIEPVSDGEKAFNTLVYTTSEIERIARLAFQLAKTRHQKITSVDKSNILESSALWRRVVTRVSGEFPEVSLNHMLVDNCAMQLIRDPKQFDVLVMGNLFGDILSDEAAMLTGSIGLLPSASLGSEIGLYEPVHGSAPDIAGKDIANPLATILSVAMMLRFSLMRPDAADEIEGAINQILEEGYRTQDIYEKETELVGTRKMGDLVVEKIFL
jgi:3-isopropylmalate dehydrogenase